MKNKIQINLTALLILILSNLCFASETPIWTCKLGDNPAALTVVTTSDTGKHSSSYILRIQDPRICDSLKIDKQNCSPFESGASYISNGSVFSKYSPDSWVAVQGEYEPGVIFYHDGPGMRVNSLSTGEELGMLPYNWYFNYGDCIKN